MPMNDTANTMSIFFVWVKTEYGSEPWVRSCSRVSGMEEDRCTGSARLVGNGFSVACDCMACGKGGFKYADPSLLPFEEFVVAFLEPNVIPPDAILTQFPRTLKEHISSKLSANIIEH